MSIFSKQLFIVGTLGILMSSVGLTRIYQVHALSNCDLLSVTLEAEFFLSTGCVRNVPSGLAPALPESELIVNAVFDGPDIENPSGIVLHWTAGNPDAEVDDFVSAIKSNKSCGPEGCSVQLFIDGDGDVHQLTPKLNTLTQHAGSANACCIGIEIAGRGIDDLKGNTQQFNAVVKTVAMLQAKFGISNVTDSNGNTGVLSHHLVSNTGKIDVGDQYLEDVVEAVASGPETGAFLEPPDPTSFTGPQAYAASQLASFGWDQREQACLDVLWGERESGWQTGIVNHTTVSGVDNKFSNYDPATAIDDRWAHGIPQHRNVVPGQSDIYGANYFQSHPLEFNGTVLGTDIPRPFLSNTDPQREIDWGLNYIKGRYATPCGAERHSDLEGWY